VFKVIKEAQDLKAHLAQLGQRVTQELLGSVVQLENKAKKETEDL
jgi:hypothetical protein